MVLFININNIQDYGLYDTPEGTVKLKCPKLEEHVSIKLLLLFHKAQLEGTEWKGRFIKICLDKRYTFC